MEESRALSRERERVDGAGSRRAAAPAGSVPPSDALRCEDPLALQDRASAKRPSSALTDVEDWDAPGL
jgi:hypothetical protein